MTKGKTQVMSQARFLLMVLALAVGFSVAPNPAHAQGGAAVCMVLCLPAQMYPALGETCKANCAATVATAVDNVTSLFVKSFVTRLNILAGARTAEAQMNSTKATAHDGAMADNLARTGNGPANASCQSEAAVNIAAGRDLGGAQDTGDGEVSRPRVSMTRRARTISTFADITCDPQHSRSCGAAVSTAAADSLNRLRTESAGSASEIARASQESALRPCSGSETDVATCRQQRQQQGEAAPVAYADINAATLFGKDTFEGTTPEARTQRVNEALFYCANLMVPGSVNRIGGANTPDSITRQAVQRSGDARVAMAVQACADAIGRRAPINFSTQNAAFDWVITAACAYRRAFTRYRENSAVVEATLDAPSGQAGFNAALDAACPAEVGQEAGEGQSVRNAVTGAASQMRLSRLELLRIISTDMFGTAQFSLNNASASQAELQRMIIAMEAVNSQLNMETLRMQEQLNLIEAAQLAADVSIR